MDTIKSSNKTTNISATKTLTDDQKQLFHDDVVSESSDFVKISLNRMAPHVLKIAPKHVVITSKNAVEALLLNFPPEALNFEHIYCVGRRTKRLIERKIGPVTHSEKNAKALSQYLVDHLNDSEITYFCSDIRLEEFPEKLAANNIVVNEVVAYETKLDPVAVKESVEGVMFFSPSTVQSYKQENDDNIIAFCIGETTAKEATKHFKDVRVAKVPTVESVIELVNEHFI